MSKKICPWEKEIRKGLCEKNLSLELQEHIKTCPDCQDIALVQGWMNRFKQEAWETDMTEKTLPDAESMWNRALSRRRPDKKLVRKALRPLIIPQVLLYGLLIAGIIYIVIWGYKKSGNLLDSQATSIILPFFGIMMIIVLISLSFCAVVVAFDKRKHPA
jgi:hypothetical protein